MSDIINLAQQEYWDAIAGPKWVALDGAMEARLARVNELLIAQARPVAGEKVLDVGCGTAATALPIAGLVGPTGQVVGVDISETMLAVARQAVAARGSGNLILRLVDAQAHRFEPRHFDLVVSRFGVIFFDDPFAAFANLRSALRPGGRICFVCWAPLADNPHWQIPLEVAVRHLGPPTPKSPRAPGPLAFSEVDYVREILMRAGFEATSVTPTRVMMAATTPDEEAEVSCKMGPPGALVSERQPDADTLAAIKRDMADAIACYVTPSGLELPATVLVVSARAADSD